MAETRMEVDSMDTALAVFGSCDENMRQMCIRDRNRNAAKGVLTQENIGFGLTILPLSAFKKPGNPSEMCIRDRYCTRSRHCI